MPFLSERQRDYLKREHPGVYARFIRDERRMGFQLKAPPEVAAVAKRGLALREEFKRGGTIVGARRATQRRDQAIYLSLHCPLPFLPRSPRWWGPFHNARRRTGSRL